MLTCNRKGCGAEARFAVKIVIPDANLDDEVAAEGLLGVVVCAKHADDYEGAPVTPYAPLVPLLADVLRFPEAVPDISEAYLATIPVSGAEYRAYVALEASLN